MLGLDIPSRPEALAAALATFLTILLSGVALKILSTAKPSTSVAAQQRWLSAMVISALTLVVIYLGGIAFAIFIAIASWLAADELLGLLSGNQRSIFPVLTHFANLSIIGSAWTQQSLVKFQQARTLPVNTSVTDEMTILWLVILLLAPAMSGQFRNMPVQQAKSVLVIIYTGWFFAHLILLRNLPHGFAATMFLVLCVVANDSFAYIFGSLFGRRRIAPLLSPKKTIEGLIGGTLGTCIVGFSSIWLLPGFAPFATIALCMAIIILAPCGDLMISAVKRNSGCKDSSNLIPGHGGLLDRASSILLVAPVFFYLFAHLSTVQRP